jgi:hypothetical protein
MVILLIYGFKRPFSTPPGSSLAFTLAAIFLMYFIAVATVAMMGQSCTLFFIIVGFSDAYLRMSRWDGDENMHRAEKHVVDNRKYKFQRVI